jgi:hypothetical protein
MEKKRKKCASKKHDPLWTGFVWNLHSKQDRENKDQGHEETPKGKKEIEGRHLAAGSLYKKTRSNQHERCEGVEHELYPNKYSKAREDKPTEKQDKNLELSMLHR